MRRSYNLIQKNALATVSFLVSFYPTLVFAQDGTLMGVLNVISDIISRLVLIVLGLGLIFFLWGLAKFILKAGDEKARAEGKQVMIWGIIILFVMITIWGIIAILQITLFGASLPDPRNLFTPPGGLST